MAARAKQRPRVVLVNRCIVRDDNGNILLIRRSQGDQHAAGFWEVPGGKLEEGQDLTNALEREVMEETGLLIEPTMRLVFAHSKIISNEPYKGLPYLVLFSIGRVVGGELKLSSEHDAHVWVSYRHALDYELKYEIREALIVLANYL